MIPRCWKNETAVIIASGPSLTKEDAEYCRGKAKVAAVNDAFRVAPWADLFYAADKRWWDNYAQAHVWKDGKEYPGVCDLPGQKWTQDEVSAKSHGLNYIDGKWMPSISHDRNFISYGYNSGFQCLNIVYLMGAKKIILLGFDMQASKGKKHWFGDHPKDLNKQSDYCKWVRSLDGVAGRYEKAGIEVINCSRETALRNYRRAALADCL